MITRDELAKVNAQTAYDAVQKLRPTLLKNRGRTSILGANIQTPMVYLDDQMLGTLERLRDIDAQTLDSIRYLSASEAQLKWGSGHPGGVLLLTSRR
jgi:hypothetical protein